MTASAGPYTYPQIGETIDGKYRIDAYLGEGGMGAVAKAWHTLRQAPVALKFMAPHLAHDAAAVERFLNEAVAASQLKSEHIVQAYDVGKLPGGSPYLVLEYLEGHDAAHLIEKEGQKGLEVPRAVHIVFQVLRGLEVAHAAGIIHRDLKPSNCFLIHHESDPEFVKILDFGISKIRKEGSASITQTNMALGTPLYMSPEQARSARDVDFRCDIYSTGVILYELLCGTAPHMAEGDEFTQVLFKLFTTDAPLITTRREGLPEGLVTVVHKALARDPAARFGSAHELAEALIPFCDPRTNIEVARFRAAQTHVVNVEPGRVRVQSSPGIDARGETAATQMASSLPSRVTGLEATGLALPHHEPSAATTDLSSAHDTGAKPSTGATRSSGLRRLMIAGGVAIVGAAGVYAFAKRDTTPRPAHDPVVTVTAPPPPPPSVVTPPSAAPTPSAIEVPSTTPSTHTTAAPPASGHHVHLHNVTVIE